MKTKHVWSKEDVEVGMIVCRAHRGRGKWKPEGWTAKWTYKIGFVSGDGETKKEPTSGRYVTNHYCLVAMTDGMVCSRGKSREELAEQFTKEDMIPMPYSWWLQMVRFLRRQTMPDSKARAFTSAYDA